MMHYTKLLFILIHLLPLSATASELVLDRHFGIQQLNQMPCEPIAAGWQTQVQNYAAFDAYLWRASLRADNATPQPLIEDLQSADFTLTLPAAAAVTMHWSQGSHAEESDFQPHSKPLSESGLSLESFGGRSSDGVLPLFNLAIASPTEPGGLIMAIGWSGDWHTHIQQLDPTHVRIRAGLKRTRFRLQPGEVVHLPSILVMSYRGRPIDGQNKFRRLVLAQFTPTNHPPLSLMPVAASVHGMLAFNDTTEQNLTALASHVASTKLPLDTFWLDAGWNAGGFPTGQGNHHPDSKRFPHGLGPVGEAARNSHLRFLMWFEPERAMRGTWLDQHHPDWLLKPSGTPPELRYMENDGFRLLDLANPQARQWAVDEVSREIEQSHVDIYRQDFNEYPSYFWHTDQPDDEVGLREIRYINGLYDFLDQLRQRHPTLIIDNCASGGRRLDIEMMTRSVCLWRSDSCWDAKTYPRNVQAMSHGLSRWMPLHGLGSVATDPVSLRSGMGACASFAINYRDSTTVLGLQRHLEHYLPIRRLYMADYYPLTAWSTDPSQWLAVQYHDPLTGEGIVQAFHGSSPSEDHIAIKLEGLEPGASYLLTDWDAPADPAKATGQDLAKTGIALSSTSNANTARVWHYKKQ